MTSQETPSAPVSPALAELRARAIRMRAEAEVAGAKSAELLAAPKSPEVPVQPADRPVV
jgi:hypothetical protein